MTSQYQRPYIDSDVFIAWIKGEVVRGVDRKAVADHVFRLAEAKTFQIVISAATLAEVHKVKGNPVALTSDQDETLLKFFENEYFDFVEVDREIGEDANRFCRKYDLQPMDAIHLACALRAKCDVLLAWDKHYESVLEPAIRCERPQMLGQLGFAAGDSDV